MRRASAPTLISGDVNRVKNDFPDLGKALTGGEHSVEFLLELQKKVVAGIEEVTSSDILALANEKVNERIGITERLDRMHEKPAHGKSEVSPKSLFNDKWNSK
jgi:archaellum component FlaC